MNQILHKSSKILHLSNIYPESYTQPGAPPNQTEDTSFNVIINNNTPLANNSNKVLSSSLGRMRQNQRYHYDHHDNDDAQRGRIDNWEEEVDEGIHHWNSLDSFDIEKEEEVGKLHIQVGVEEGNLHRRVGVVLMDNHVVVVL